MSIENGDFNVMNNRQVATRGGDWAVRAPGRFGPEGKTLRVWWQNAPRLDRLRREAYVKVAMVLRRANP